MIWSALRHNQQVDIIEDIRLFDQPGFLRFLLPIRAESPEGNRTLNVQVILNINRFPAVEPPVTSSLLVRLFGRVFSSD